MSGTYDGIEPYRGPAFWARSIWDALRLDGARWIGSVVDTTVVHTHTIPAGTFAGFDVRVDPDCPPGMIYFMPTVTRSIDEVREQWPAPVSETIPMRYVGGRVVLTQVISGEPGPSIFYDGPDDIPTAAQAHTDALLDLARNGREQDFRDLALMVGVEREQIDALWDGAVKRLKGGAA